MVKTKEEKVITLKEKKKIVKENIKRIFNNQPLTEPLATLNKKYNFEYEYNLAWDLKFEKEIKARRREEKKKYREDNKEHIKKWLEENPDCAQKYYEQNKEKIRKYNLKKYDITIEDYNKLLKKQGGVCAICRIKRNGKLKSLVVDHNHKTGKVRALLCYKCNSMIGFSNEDISTLKKAIKYLEKHNGVSK